MSIEVELTDLAYGGDAVGRYEGRVLFVPGGIPGERVRVEIVEERGGHARAELLEMLRPAPERVEPQYPEAARQQHLQGPVVLSVLVGTDGAVRELKVVSGDPLLAKAATDRRHRQSCPIFSRSKYAAASWRFFAPPFQSAAR